MVTSKAAQTLLKECGWFPNRMMELDPITQPLIDEGFELFPAAREVLESLQGLSIHTEHRRIAEIDCSDGLGCYDSLDFWYPSKPGINLFPFGYNSSGSLLIDQYQRLYVTEWSIVMRARAEDFGSALDVLLFSTSGRNWLTIPPQWKAPN